MNSNDIRTESNLVEVVTVKEKPDRDPQEKTLGEVWIWQEADTITVNVRYPDGSTDTVPRWAHQPG